MWKLVHTVRRLGTQEGMDPRLVRRIVLMNTIALTLCAVTSPYVVVFGAAGSPAISAVCALAVVLYATVILLAAKVSFRAARIAIFAIFPFILFIVANLMGSRAGVQMAFFPSVCLPVLLCDIEERGTLAYGLGATIGAFMVGQATEFALLGPPFVGPVAQDVIRYTMVPVLFVLLLTEVLYFAVLSRRAERSLDSGTRAMRVVLDNVDQGLLMIEPDGRLLAERSNAANRWLGWPNEADSLVDVVSAYDPKFASWLALGLAALIEGVLPSELLIDQLPKQLHAGDRILETSYKLIDGANGRMLVVLTDVTETLQRMHAEEMQRETVALVTRALADRSAIRACLDEARGLVTRLVTGASEAAGPEVLARDVHTLKGNAALIGVASVARLCHEIEDVSQESGASPSPASLAQLAARFEAVTRPVLPLLGTGSGPDVSPDDVAHLRALVVSGADGGIILAEIDTWFHPPLERRLLLLAEQARALADRLGRGDLDVRVDARRVRMNTTHWAPLWSTLVHVVRNAIDHGIETPDERTAAGKTQRPVLHLVARANDGGVVLEIGDDGRGIDWRRVAMKARDQGLPSETRHELVDAIFTDGVSTRDEVSETSGRGVGLAAVRAACTALGARIEVESSIGHGTTFLFSIPAARRPIQRPSSHEALSA